MAKGGNGGGGGLPKITGKNNKDDLLIGTGVAELIKGLSGNDTLIGGGGDDILDGGNDYDTVIYDGSVFGYAIDIAAGTITDTDLSDGDDGADTLIGVEQVNFGDATVYFDGTNNNPLIAGSINVGSVTELNDGDPGENSFLHNAGGTIDFLEFDRTSSNSVNVVAAGAGYLGALTAQFSDADTSDGAGQITWSFDVEDADIDYLAAGETLVQSYDVIINDGQGGSATETITVTINGSNDAPSEILLSQSSVDESVINVQVGVLSAVDLDSSGPITYSIVPGGDGALFELVGNELWLGATPLDYELMSTREVTIRATDELGASYDQTLVIDVVDSIFEYLTTSADSNVATGSDTVFIADATTLNPQDYLVASDFTYDWLYLTSYGSYDLAGLSAFSGIDRITVDTYDEDMALPFGGDIALVMTELSGVVEIEYFTEGNSESWLNGVAGENGYIMTGGTGNDIVHTQGFALLTQFVGGAGNDEVYAGALEPMLNFFGGEGDDLLQIQNEFAWHWQGQFDGGTGYDVMSFAGSGYYLFEQALITGFEHLRLDAPDVNVIVTGNELATFDQISSDQSNAVLLVVANEVDLRGKAISGLRIEGEDFGVNFLVDDKAVAFQVFGSFASYANGGVDDVIIGSGFTFTAAERQMIFDTSLVDVVSDDSGIYGNDMENELFANAAGGIIDGGGFSDYLHGGAGDDTFVFAPGDSTGGFDYVINFEAGAGSNDVIDLRAYGAVAAQAAIDTAIELAGTTQMYFQDSDDFIVLDGVLLASLHADDFLI